MLNATLLQMARECTLATAHDVSLSTRPVLIRLDDALVEPDSLPRILSAALAAEGRTRVKLSESPRRFAPEVSPDDESLIAPADRELELYAALRHLRRRSESSGGAGLRQFPLGELPAVAAATSGPLERVRRALSVVEGDPWNLWLGDGSLSSSFHFDERDNLLVQLMGSKEVLLAPPELLMDDMGFRARQERRHVLRDDPASSAADGTATELSGRGEVVNHSPVAAFEEQQSGPPPSARAARATVHCSVPPGHALFIPALWAHAVASTPAAITIPGAAHGELNAAANLWFTQGTHSLDAAVQAAPRFAPAHVCRGQGLEALGRHAEAALAYEAALALPTLPDSWWRSTERRVAAARAEAAAREYRARLKRAVARAGGWSRDVERRVRAEVWPDGGVARGG